MKRSLFVLLIIFVGLPLPLGAQNKKSTATKTDLIITTQSEKIDAIITEVSDETVSYKKASNPKGPTFVLSTEKISTILYANGEVQVIKHKVAISSSRKQEEPTDAAVTPTPPTAPPSRTVHSPAPTRMQNDVPIVNTREVKPAKKAEETTQDNTPYFSMCGHLKGLVGGLGSGFVSGGFGGDLEFGFVTGKDINFLGAGIGFDVDFAKSGGSLNISSGLPIYACDRLYFSSTPLAPYLDIALGGFISTTKGSAGTGGLYFHPGLGVAIPAGEATYVHLNVGYELRYAKVSGYEVLGHAIYFRIGFGGR